MTAINRPLLRLALNIAAQLAGRPDPGPLIELPQAAWNRCTDLARQIRRAQLRGWTLAVNQLRCDLRSALGAFLVDVTPIHARLPTVVTRRSIISAQDIYRDLLALEYEFDGLEIAEGRLSLTTEPIELRGVYLGPFQIQLDTHRLLTADRVPYRVVASDPHPAAGRDNVTHPHVMDEALCEGEGKTAIRQALAQGRLLDFFTLVVGILKNYNPESPFVELELWQGQCCDDCGTRTDDEDCFSCQACGDRVCCECGVMCTRCEESYCSGCTTRCTACESALCNRCRTRCGGCGRNSCSDCLDDHERCADCHEDEPEELLESDAETASTSLQSHGLGQAVISTGCR